MELRQTSCLKEESVSAGCQSIWCGNPNCWSLENNSSGKLWNFISQSHRSCHWDVSHAYSLKHISTLAWQISMLITCCNFEILHFRIIQSLLPFLCWPVLSQAISKGCSVTFLLYKLWKLMTYYKLIFESLLMSFGNFVCYQFFYSFSHSRLLNSGF